MHPLNHKHTDAAEKALELQVKLARIQKLAGHPAGSEAFCKAFAAALGTDLDAAEAFADELRKRADAGDQDAADRLAYTVSLAHDVLVEVGRNA